MTKAQIAAFEWLEKHGGDGCFDKNGVVLAMGESAPFTRHTWNALCDAGRIIFYGGRRDGQRGYGRLKVIR